MRLKCSAWERGRNSCSGDEGLKERTGGRESRKREMSIIRGNWGLCGRKGQGEQGCLVITYHVYPETAVATGE